MIVGGTWRIDVGKGTTDSHGKKLREIHYAMKKDGAIIAVKKEGRSHHSCKERRKEPS